MNERVEAFKNHVRELVSASEEFTHRDWFVAYHLEIVERIALELCDIYTDADREMVRLLVWLHDYGKIISTEDEKENTLFVGGMKLQQMGFDEETVKTAVSSVEMIDAKEGLDQEDVAIEVKIVSSADGASHLVGPFFMLYWKEHADEPFEGLMKENQRKARVDWEQKIVLPEVKEAFRGRYEFLMEQTGDIPTRIISS